MVLNQLISGTSDKAKKKRGERKMEKGILSSFIVEAESIVSQVMTLGQSCGYSCFSLAWLLQLIGDN